MVIDFSTVFRTPQKESWVGYEADERIVISDGHDASAAHQNLDKRISAIFTPMKIADQWTTPKDYVQQENSILLDDRYPAPRPFKLNAEQFLKRAYAARPAEPQPTVSAFSQWLYSLYSNVHGDAEDMERGIEVEKRLFFALDNESRRIRAEEIEAFRYRALPVSDQKLRDRGWAEWRLVHCGIHLPGDVTSWFDIKDLRVGRVPLRASPDLLYQNTATGEVVIVEIKSSTLQIPSNLWPNIWGQLWSYAQIPLVREASSVTVVGEVWGIRWHHKSFRDKRTLPSLYMRASVRRDPRAESFDRFFRALFNIYRSA